MSNTKRVAVVVPHHRFPLSANDKISFRHMQHFLKNFDRFVLHPGSMTPDVEDCTRIPLPDATLGSELGYNQLLVSHGFYRFFDAYDYILIYQLDCLVFSPDLLSWCDKGWDYVGAPWTKDYWRQPEEGWHGVGNGGLSLRKVSSCLEVLRHNDTAKHLEEFRSESGLGYQHEHEDLFWSWIAKKIRPDFLIPGPEEAIRFAIECHPSATYALTGKQLPFGCHNWVNYEPDWWRQFMLSESTSNG